MARTPRKPTPPKVAELQREVRDLMRAYMHLHLAMDACPLLSDLDCSSDLDNLLLSALEDLARAKQSAGLRI